MPKKNCYKQKKLQYAPKSFCLLCTIPVYIDEKQINSIRIKYRKNRKCLHHKLILKHWWYSSKKPVKQGIDVNQNVFLKSFLLVNFNYFTNYGAWICFKCLEDMIELNQERFYAKLSKKIYANEEANEEIQKFILHAWKINLLKYLHSVMMKTPNKN